MKTKVLSLNKQAVVAIGIVTILLLSSYAGSRTITDTSDDIQGYITCSNNNVYTGTAAYLQDAIESMNNQTGKVTLSASMNISVAATIQLYDKVELDLNGAILWATADVDVIWMHPESWIHGGTIRVSGLAYTRSCINISALGQNHSFLASGGYKRRTTVSDMYLRSKSMSGYGVHMYVPNTANDHQIGGCLISNVQTFGFNTSFYLQNRWADAGVAGGWINGNQFSDLQGYGDWCFIRLNGMADVGATTPSWTATDGNTFTNLNMQPTTGSDYGLCIEGYYNSFNSVMVWDGGSYDVAGVYFRNTSSQNSVVGANGLGSSKVLDYGSFNTIQRSAIAQLWNLNLTHASRYQASSTGWKFYANTAVNPYTYFYGATGNFGWLRSKSTGEFEIGSDDKTVLVNDVLQLQARTTKPSPASAGQQYYNSTDGHMYSYLGGSWVALDAGSVSDDTAYGAGWNGVTVITPSKNAVYDQFHLFDVLNGLMKSDGAGVFSAVTDNSGGWNSARAVLTANSNGYNSTRSVVSGNGAGWNSTRSVVSSKGAAWNASASNLFTFGLLWNNTRSVVSAKGAGWNSTQAVVTAKSGTWNSTSTQLAAWRTLWNSTRAVVSAKSATWNATSALVTSKSAAWNASATGYNVTYITNSKGNYWTATGANINQAIWDLNSTKGGTVWIPGTTLTGTGTTKYMILMCSGVTLKGAGMNSTTLKLTLGSGAQAVIYCLSINNYTICDLSIDGFNDSTSNNYQAIYTRGCKYFNYQNLHIQNMYRTSIGFGDNTYNTESKYGKLSNIWLDPGQDIFPTVYQPLGGYHVNYTIFENIHIHGDGTKNTKGIWGMDWVRTSWNSFSNIYIDGVGYGCKWFATGNHNITVNGLHIRGCTNTSDATVWLYAIRDSTFMGLNIEAQFQGIQLASAGPRITISGAIIYCKGNAPGIWASGDFLSFDSVQLFGNDLSYGMYLYGCDDSKFSKIEINNWLWGVYFENCDRDDFSGLKVTNNVGLGWYGKTSTFFGIHDSDFINNGGDAIDLADATACHNFTIHDNLFSNNPGKSIDLSATSNYLNIHDNTCTFADEIDLNAANSTTRLCHDNIARIT